MPVYVYEKIISIAENKYETSVKWLTAVDIYINIDICMYVCIYKHIHIYIIWSAWLLVWIQIENLYYFICQQIQF